MNVPEPFKKPLKLLLLVCSLIAIYSLIGFYLIPSVLKWKLPVLIEQETGRKTRIEKITMNPFLFSVQINGFELQELKEQPFSAFDNFEIDFNALKSIRHSALVFDSIRLHKLFVHIAKQKNGDFNFKDLIKTRAKEHKEENGKLFPVIISKLTVTEGQLVFEDEHFAKPVKEELIPINLDIENFTTVSDQLSRADISIAMSSGGRLDWQGQLGINPIRSVGHVKLENINLQKLYELALQDKVQFNLQGTQLIESDYEIRYADNTLSLTMTNSNLGISGFQYSEHEQNKMTAQVPSLALAGTYKVAFSHDNFQLSADNSKIEIHDMQLSGLNPDKVLFNIPFLALITNYQVTIKNNKLAFTTSQGQLDIKNFELSEKDQHKLLVKIPALALKGIGFGLDNQQFDIDSLTVNDANFKATLNQDGVINYQALFSVPATELNNAIKTEIKPVEPAKAPWIVNVNNLALTNLGVEFEDQMPKKPAKLNVRPIHFKANKFSNKTGSKFPFQLNAGVNDTGSINLTGDSVIEPLFLQSNIEIKTIALDKFQSYVEKFARVDIIDGKLNIKGNASVAIAEKDRLDIKFKGDTGIANLITRDQKVNKDLVKWKKLALEDMNIDLLANRYTAASLIIDKPYARVTIRKDKTVNFSDIVIADKSTSHTASISARKATLEQSRPYFELGKLQLIDGSSDFADLSLILPFAAPIESLDGGASGMSSDQKSKIKINLKGTAYELSAVDIKGEISPHLGNYNVTLNFQGMPMPLISPYMAQFAGYKVEKGKLTLGLQYNIVNKMLTASNSIQIDQFELGEKVEHPEAVSLPMGLAIALLKDSNGRIKIDIPLTGSLEDPKFSVGRLIVDALVNVLTKIVTSPFNAIAGLIGGGEDLSVVIFAAGDATLSKQQMAKLDSIAKALKDRPVLNLEIKGNAFTEKDWPALQGNALRDQIKKLRAAEVNKEGGRKTRAEHVDLSDEDYQRLLAQEFIAKFPLLAERSFLGTPKLIAPQTGDFYEIAKQKLSETIKPEPQRLKELAVERAQAIAKYVVQKGGISNDRVFILDTALDPESKTTEIVSTLSLKANGL
ncbi:MAG: DUF748 domain-containing protein [Methylococcaceae bacterium]|nr:DUF748 domain-containing protein [Methylococcaceae bacterium]